MRMLNFILGDDIFRKSLKVGFLFKHSPVFSYLIKLVILIKAQFLFFQE